MDKRILTMVVLLLSFPFITHAIADTGSLSGHIRDARTNEPLIGATVKIVGSTLGAATNQNGFYSQWFPSDMLYLCLKNVNNQN